MADLDFVFHASEIAERPEFGVLPVGDYIAEITNSDYKPTKKGNGKYIELEFTIIDGAYVGRKFWDRLNIQHENKAAMDIANSALRDLLVATGLASQPFSKTVTLHNIPVKLKIGITKRKDTGEDQNNVKYKSINYTSSPSALKLVANQTGSPEASSDGPKKKPWEK
jgi:hypothetical protein